MIQESHSGSQRMAFELFTLKGILALSTRERGIASGSPGNRLAKSR